MHSNAVLVVLCVVLLACADAWHVRSINTKLEQQALVGEDFEDNSFPVDDQHTDYECDPRCPEGQFFVKCHDDSTRPYCVYCPANTYDPRSNVSVLACKADADEYYKCCLACPLFHSSPLGSHGPSVCIPDPSSSNSPSASHTISDSISLTTTPRPSSSPSPSDSPSDSPSTSESPLPPSPSPESPSSSLSESESVSVSESTSESASPTFSGSTSASPTPSMSAVESVTPSVSASASASVSPSTSISLSASPSPSTSCGAKGVAGWSESVDYHDTLVPGHIALSFADCAPNNPVVFLSPPTTKSLTCAVPRVQRLPHAYKVWLAEPQYTNSVHSTAEAVSWVVLEVGEGPNYYVGTVNLPRLASGIDNAAEGWVTIAPPSARLGKRPWVFQFIQTSSNGADPDLNLMSLPQNIRGYVKTRMTLAANSWAFNLRLESDGSYPAVASENVGYLAIDSGCSNLQEAGDVSTFSGVCPTQYGLISIGGEVYDYVLGVTKTSGLTVTETVIFGRTFVHLPVVLANIQTFNGYAPCELRTVEVTSSAYRFTIQGDLAAGPSAPHPEEWVAFLAIGVFA